MKKQIGIWLDYRTAVIVDPKTRKTIENIVSEIEEGNIKGGARSKTPWGPMDKVSESKVLHRRDQQEKNYYENIKNKVKDYNEIYVFGPAEAKTGLVKAMTSDNSFNGQVMQIDTADSMTENQMIAKVSDFFKR